MPNKSKNKNTQTVELKKLIGDDLYNSRCLSGDLTRAKGKLKNLDLDKYKKADDFIKFIKNSSSPKKQDNLGEKRYLEIILLALRRAKVDPEFKEYLLYNAPDLFNEPDGKSKYTEEKQALIKAFKDYNPTEFIEIKQEIRSITENAVNTIIKTIEENKKTQDTAKEQEKDNTPTNSLVATGTVSATTQLYTPQKQDTSTTKTPFSPEIHDHYQNKDNTLSSSSAKTVPTPKTTKPGTPTSFWQKIKQSWRNTSLTAKIILTTVTIGFFITKILINLESCKAILAGAANYLKTGLAAAYNLITTWWAATVAPALKVFLASTAAPYIIAVICVTAILLTYSYYKFIDKNTVGTNPSNTAKPTESGEFERGENIKKTPAQHGQTETLSTTDIPEVGLK